MTKGLQGFQKGHQLTKGRPAPWARNNPQVFKKGMKPWNTGIPLTTEQKKAISKKLTGVHRVNAGTFKKGQKPSEKAIEINRKRFTGENNPKYNGGLKDFVCIECGKVFQQYPSGIKKACSTKCMGKYQSKVRRGEKSSNWKGGITPINRSIRTSLEYKLWRTAVFERDNYTCIWCGARSGNGKAIVLNADHIKQFAFYPELRFAIDNGRTLCTPCHKKTDSFGGRGHTKI